MALRLKAKAGSALAIGRDPEIADKTGVGRGHSWSLRQVYHFGKRSFDRVIHVLPVFIALGSKYESINLGSRRICAYRLGSLQRRIDASG